VSARVSCLCEHAGEISAPGESIGGVLREGDGKHRVEGRERGVGVRRRRRWRGEMAADHDRCQGVVEVCAAPEAASSAN
jgi:hypothetical protein